MLCGYLPCFVSLENTRGRTDEVLGTNACTQSVPIILDCVTIFPLKRRAQEHCGIAVVILYLVIC